MKSLQHQIAAHTSWANTENRSARTAKSRKAFEDKFLAEAGGDPKRAESARKAYFLALAKKSAEARQRRREEGGAPLRSGAEEQIAKLKATLAELEAQLAAGGDAA